MIRTSSRAVPVAPLTESASDLAALFGGALLRPLPSGRFALLSAAPAWLADVWPGLDLAAADLRAASLFLDSFLRDADAFWASAATAPLGSGVWTETTAAGAPMLLEAFALGLASGPALLVRPPAVPVHDYQHALQQSREQALAFSTLRRDFQQHHDALACLLHDLGTPLASVRASLEFLRQDGLVDAPGLELLGIAQAQAERLQAYVRAFLDSVAAPVRPPVPLDGEYPDLRAVVNDVVHSLRADGPPRGVRVVVQEGAMTVGDGAAALVSPAVAPLPVVAERVRLERVLVNLIENALRHSPSGGTVAVALAPDATGVRLSVSDEGPGVPEAFIPQLFRRFAQGPARRASACTSAA